MRRRHETARAQRPAQSALELRRGVGGAFGRSCDYAWLTGMTGDYPVR
jgi:hypothetical protein